ncbi:TPA: hypothetical protein ACH3X1_015695 [Trebouxia sp. C0004]
MLARFLQRSAGVEEFLALGQRHDLLEDACLALMQTESDKAPLKWDLNAVGIALRGAVHHHHSLTAEAAEAELEAANDATGGEPGKSIRKLVALPYFEYVASSQEAQVALCVALGVVPMEVTGPRAEVVGQQAEMPSVASLGIMTH